MRVKLTEARVKGLETNRRRVVWDAEVRGLGVRVSPSGRRSWIVQYRMPGGGRQCKLTLGTWPEIRVQAARELAREVLRDKGLGKDPAVERRRAGRALSLREVFEGFMTEVESKRRPNTVREYRCIFERWILPALGSGPCAAISYQDVAALHARVGRRAPVQANRLAKVLGRVLDYAQHHGAYPAEVRNPARGVERFPERVDTGRALTPAEMRAVWGALEGGESIQAAAVRVVLLSGLRPAEVRLLTWKEVEDDAGRVLRLRKSKTGARVAYVGPRAGAIITAQPELSSHVFTGRRGSGPYGDLRYTWDRVRERAELPGVRLYDAGRHTYASTAAEVVGLPRHRVGLLLGHSPGSRGITGRYTHAADASLLRDAERVESALWELLTGEVAGGEVVPFAATGGAAR